MSSIYFIENYNFDIKYTGKLYRNCAKTRYITTISYHIYYYFRCFYYTPCFFSVIIITVYFVISVLFLFFFSPTSLLNFYVCTHMTVYVYSMYAIRVHTHTTPLHTPKWKINKILPEFAGLLSTLLLLTLGSFVYVSARGYYFTPSCCYYYYKNYTSEPLFLIFCAVNLYKIISIVSTVSQITCKY